MTIGQGLRNAVGTVYRAAIGAAAAGFSVIRAIGGEFGQSIRSASGETIVPAADLEQIATYAGSYEAAKQAFAAAAPQQQVDASMITFQPWSMGLSDLNTAPSYDLNIEFTVPGLPEKQYKILAGITSLPNTKQDAIDLAQANAEPLLGRYLVGTSLDAITSATVDSIVITVSRA